MAEYKRKNVKKLKSQKPKKSAVAESYKVTSFSDTGFVENISVKSAKEAKAERRFEKKKEKYLRREQPEKRVVTSSKSPRELNRTSGSLKVVKGTKGPKKVRNIISVTVSLMIIGCLLLVHLLSPTGIADLIECSFARMGSGTGYPLTLSGGTVLDVNSVDGCISVLSDTYIEMYNSSSKELVSDQHKFSSPKAVTSETRVLVYDQGAVGVAVYDISGKLFQREMKEPVITAAVGRNGTYCVVTDPEGITAKVYVYDKNDNLKFKWESDTDLINAAAVSDNGKFVLLSTINADKGEYTSHIKVFEGGESKPVREETVDDIIHSIEPLGRTGFVVRVGSELKRYDAKNGTIAEITDDTVRQKYLSPEGELGLFSNSDGNKGTLTVWNKYFEKDWEIDIVSSPKKIEWNDEYIVCAKDYSLYIYDYSGKEVNVISTNTPIEWFVISDDNILVINNTTIVSYSLTGGTDSEHNS